MDALIVYHPYAVSPDPAVLARQAVANQALALLRPHLVRGDRICHEPCGPDDRYELGLLALWGLDTLLIWEHDMAPTPAQIASLRACPEPLCAAPYPLYWSPRIRRAWREAWTLIADARTDGSAAVARSRTATAIRAGLLTDPPGVDPEAVRTTWAHRIVVTDYQQRWVTTGEPWADLVGNGCLKIDATWQRTHVPAWRSGAWDTLDSRMSDWYRRLGQRVHLHWDAGPVAHHHGCACHPDPSCTP